ncbi:MAG: TonB-dependent receptor, partial [Acidobacteria bacterium]|nr:TonB-dependent receptor [Acidobacteriota bacterium]
MNNYCRSCDCLKSIPIIALLALLFLGAEGAVLAQSSSGSIRGTVKDATGGVVPGATVRITDLGTNAAITLITGAEGDFIAPALRPVYYDVTAQMSGFKSTTVKGVKVDTAKDTRMEITLEVGELNQTVNVTSESPLLQTAGGSVAQTVEQKVIVDLPLNGRNTLELAYTLPGVTGNVGSELTGVYASDVAPGREISINGARVGSTQFFADGASVTSVALARTTVSFSPDTIQEFTVQQSNYSAQYSQAGGAIIQQTTKSGTNEFHGTLYWFHRQKALTANPFDATRLPLFDNDARPPLRRQQAGATVGGPVWLPGLYQGRNRTFFFFSYEPTRQLESLITYSAVRVPTELERKGDFSQSRVYFTNGTSQPYALLYQQFNKRADGSLVLRPNPNYNASLPADASNPMWQYNNFALFNPNDPDPNRRGRVLVDAAGRSFVNPLVSRMVNELYPAPNLPMITSGSNAGANFAYFRKAENTDDRYTIRIDHRLNEAHSIYGRYTWQPLYGDRYFRDVIQNAGISETTQARQVLVNWTGVLRPNIINELRLNYNFGDFSRNFPRDLTTADYTSKYLDVGGAGKGVPNAIGYGMARFFGGAAPRSASEQSGGRNFDQVGFSQPQDVGKNTEHTYLLNDDLSWVRGAHTFKMGFSGQELMLNQGTLGFGSLAGGRYNFGREQTADRNCGAGPYSGSITGCSGTALGGDAFASFLMGIPSGLQVQTENLAKPYYYRWMALGAYFQDDWKIRPNLTLNIGLRYQYQSPRWEKQNYQGQLNLTRLEPNPFAKDFQGKPVTWDAPVFEFSGYDGRSRYMVEPQKLDFEPRFGFAWTPGFDWNRDRRIVIRGGYGLSHATLTGNDREPVPNIGTQTFGGYRALSYVLGPNNNSSPNITATCGLAICNDASLPMQFGFNNPILGGDPRIGTPPANGLIRPGDQAEPDFSGPRQDPRYGRIGFIGNPDFRTPVIQNYSLQVQYQFSGSMVLTVGYQGARGTHLMGPSYNINRRDPFIGDPSVKYPGYQSSGSPAAIYLLDPTDYTSVYHAGAADLERRFSEGLQFRFNYTFSKAMDNSSGGIKFPIPNNSFNNAAIGIRLTRNQQVDNRAAERSVSSTDTPHVFNLSALYELPFGKGKRWLSGNAVLTPILGGWQATALGRWRSGYPITVTMSGFNAIDSGIPGGEFRPDRILGVPLKNPNWNKSNWRTEPYVNPRAFAWPEPGKFGNTARNLSELRSPWFNTLDSSLMKRFSPLKDERRIFEFRLEVFNLFNMSVLNMTNGTNVQVLSGNQNILLTNASTGLPVADQANVKNRYANLRAPGVWDAIIAKAQGV